MTHKIALGLNVFNILDIRNAIDIYAMTGKPDDPGTYYTDYVWLPGTDPSGQIKTKFFFAHRKKFFLV